MPIPVDQVIRTVDRLTSGPKAGRLLVFTHAHAKEVTGMQPAHGTDARSAADAGQGDDMALDDLLGEFGDRWDIARITGGYRAVPCDTGGHTPIPRYGRTPAELGESIRMVDGQPAPPENCG
jgi:hypothetical protein